MAIWRLSLNTFGCVPRELKQRLTSREWQTLRLVCKREPVGADRRDIGLAKAVAQLVVMNAKEGTQAADIIKAILPVKLFDDATIDDDYAAMMAFSSSHNAVMERGDKHLNTVG